MGFGASNIDVEDIVRDVDDRTLREELESCKQFLTDSEMENGRHRVFNLPCHPSNFLCSTILWILYSKTEMCCKSQPCILTRSEKL